MNYGVCKAQGYNGHWCPRISVAFKQFPVSILMNQNIMDILMNRNIMALKIVIYKMTIHHLTLTSLD